MHVRGKLVQIVDAQQVVIAPIMQGKTLQSLPDGTVVIEWNPPAAQLDQELGQQVAAHRAQLDQELGQRFATFKAQLDQELGQRLAAHRAQLDQAATDQPKGRKPGGRKPGRKAKPPEG